VSNIFINLDVQSYQMINVISFLTGIVIIIIFN